MDSHIIGIRQLFCRFAEIIVDLFDAAGKGRSIMPVRIERFYDEFFRRVAAHFDEMRE